MIRFFSLLLVFYSATALSQEIALTFDDAPTADGPRFSGEERSQRIMDHLKKNQVQEVAFFVLTGNINQKSKNRLTRYVEAGHVLANHSHSHRWIHQAGIRSYIRDLTVADSILNFFPGYQKWYRYPFLDEGRSVTARDSIRTALQDLHLSNGYVTIDNYDWYLNHLLQQGHEHGKELNEDALREVYIDHIYNSIIFYDSIAREHLGRSPKHVLLLHENDLAALFLGDLIIHLKEKGWKIISPREAYRDPIAHYLPDVLFNGQGRVAAVAREKGVAPGDLVQLSEDEEFLDALVKKKKVFD